MEMSKGILFYRLTLIIACLAVVAFTYPSEFSKFALIAGIVGIFIILAKKTPSSRSVKGHSSVSRREMNWVRTRDGRKPS
ncbi:hypothetical protein IK9_05200 [Bacillus cereus VD166]|uniref:Uncharacterized protein n=1 Tax=Bacillus cereus TaxID=1396 RepID=A0A5B9HXI9_BACCE|nr:hypothetical protein IK9_05200 [Bacillus cereus VD166]QEF20254.1 hypothetical protein FRY47_28565 [Bacillus cereus]